MARRPIVVYGWSRAESIPTLGVIAMKDHNLSRIRVASLVSMIGLALAGWITCAGDRSRQPAGSASEARSVEVSTAEDTSRAAAGLAGHSRRGRQAIDRGDWQEAAVEYRAALELAPDQPAILWRLARIEARRQDVEAAIRYLRRLVELGATADLAQAESFADLLDRKDVSALANALAANAPPRQPAERMVTFADEALWPEGIAWDGVEGVLYVGSIHRRKIVRVTTDGQVEDLGATTTGDLLEILGVWVDEERRRLWAASYDDEAESASSSELVELDLNSGRLVGRHPLPDLKAPRLLNDVTVTADGTAWVTETYFSELYRLPPGGDELVLDRQVEGANFLNGIAVGGDGKTLYLAHLEGITVVDTATGESQPLAVGGNFLVSMADGVSWHDNNLYLVQNQEVLGQRVVRVALDASGRRATALEVLPSGWPEGLLPYTSAVGDGYLWLVAAADFSRRGEADVPPPAVLRVPLQ